MYQVAPSDIESKASVVSDAIASLLSPRRSGSLAANDPGEREDDPYSNSMFEGICAGVEDGVDGIFCDVLCYACVKERCKRVVKHLGCAESYWDDVKAESYVVGPRNWACAYH